MTYITSSPNQSEYAQPNVTECCSVVNQCLGSASEGAPYSPHRAGHPLQFQFFPVSVRHTVANVGGSHVPVSGAGCTVNEGYYSSETNRLCSGIESPRLRLISEAGHPQYSTWQILKLYALCAALGFGAVAMAHAKRTADLNANWEMIND